MKEEVYRKRNKTEKKRMRGGVRKKGEYTKIETESKRERARKERDIEIEKTAKRRKKGVRVRIKLEKEKFLVNFSERVPIRYDFGVSGLKCLFCFLLLLLYMSKLISNVNFVRTQS